jgi:hypothetical protein
MLCELQHCNYKHVIGQVPLIHRLKVGENRKQSRFFGGSERHVCDAPGSDSDCKRARPGGANSARSNFSRVRRHGPFRARCVCSHVPENETLCTMKGAHRLLITPCANSCGKRQAMHAEQANVFVIRFGCSALLEGEWLIERTLTIKTVGSAFEKFVADVEPRLREALSASLGSQRGRDATADALVYASENWDWVREMDNPAGYLYVVSRGTARTLTARAGSPTQSAFPARPS